MSEECEECAGCVENTTPVMPPQTEGTGECPGAEPCSSMTPADCVKYLGAPIMCGSDEVVATNDTVTEAISKTIAYFCAEVTGISAIQKKYVKEDSYPSDESTTTTIAYADYSACLVASGYCGIATPSLVDVMVKGYWYDTVGLFWEEFTHTDKTEVRITAAGAITVIGVLPVRATYPAQVRIIVKR